MSEATCICTNCRSGKPENCLKSEKYNITERDFQLPFEQHPSDEEFNGYFNGYTVTDTLDSPSKLPITIVLASRTNPQGVYLENLCDILIRDINAKQVYMELDPSRPENRHLDDQVSANNKKMIELLRQLKSVQLESLHMLDEAAKP